MMAQADYGPVPMSRIKSELRNVREALRNQRRVTLSRHGVVVAAIEPLAEEKHSHLLFTYMTADGASTTLSATDIGRGSPSAPIRTAEAGIDIPFIDRGRVLGVVTGTPVLPGLDVVEAQAATMAEWVRTHEDATAEEFAAFSDALVTVDAAAIPRSLTAQETRALATAGQAGRLEVLRTVPHRAVEIEVGVDPVLVVPVGVEEPEAGGALDGPGPVVEAGGF